MSLVTHIVKKCSVTQNNYEFYKDGFPVSCPMSHDHRENVLLLHVVYVQIFLLERKSISVWFASNALAVKVIYGNFCVVRFCSKYSAFDLLCLDD